MVEKAEIIINDYLAFLYKKIYNINKKGRIVD